MACTYGESWALFHSDIIAPETYFQPLPSTSSTSSTNGPPNFDPGPISPVPNPTTRSSPSSPSSGNQALADHMILAEIQRLRQKISEIKRSEHLSSMPPKPRDVARVSQRVPSPPDATSLPNHGPSRSDQGSRNNNSGSFNLPCCLDPRCNGRVFSTQSNLARHQREKHGEAAKLRCSFCDADFSRSSARNAHEAERRCRNNNNNDNNNDDHDDR